MESVVDGNSGDVRKRKCGQRDRPKAWSVKNTNRGERERQSVVNTTDESVVNKTDESVVKERDKVWSKAWSARQMKRGQSKSQSVVGERHKV